MNLLVRLFDIFRLLWKRPLLNVGPFSLSYIHLLVFFAESIEQMVVNMGAKNEISPTLVEIVSLYDEDNERSSETFSVGEKFDTKADMFDPNDVELDNDSSGNYEAWTFNHDKETSVFNEGSSFDSTLQNHSEVPVSCQCFKFYYSGHLCNTCFVLYFTEEKKEVRKGS